MILSHDQAVIKELPTHDENTQMPAPKPCTFSPKHSFKKTLGKCLCYHVTWRLNATRNSEFSGSI